MVIKGKPCHRGRAIMLFGFCLDILPGPDTLIIR
nr:MAG TPA: hypothetical protein [Caudoviricetes sp.]